MSPLPGRWAEPPERDAPAEGVLHGDEDPAHPAPAEPPLDTTGPDEAALQPLCEPQGPSRHAQGQAGSRCMPGDACEYDGRGRTPLDGAGPPPRIGDAMACAEVSVE